MTQPLILGFAYAWMPQPNSSGGWNVSIRDEDDRLVDVQSFEDFWEAMRFRWAFNGVVR